MKTDYPNIGASFSDDDEKRERLSNAIAGLRWVQATGKMSLPAAQGFTINQAIQDFRIPKVSHLAYHGGEIDLRDFGQGEGSATLLGIRGHYKNGAVQVYLADLGDRAFPVRMDHWEPGEVLPIFPCDLPPEKAAGDSVTMYARGEFLGAIRKVELKGCVVEFGPYAQHPVAAFVSGTPRGKRKARRFGPYYAAPGPLIVGGWDRPDPPDGYEPVGSPDPSGLSVSRSRYLSCDPRWQSDFDAFINPLLAEQGIPVVFDLRKEIKSPSESAKE